MSKNKTVVQALREYNDYYVEPINLDDDLINYSEGENTDIPEEYPVSLFKEFSDISKLSPSEIANIVNQQVHNISYTEKKIKEANELAESAMRSANEARDKSAGIGKKKVAIESLQESGALIAEAVISQSEALTQQHKNTKSIAETTKFLLYLGTGNMIYNRVVVEKLEKMLEEASEEELSDIARDELENVVRELKSRQDLEKKLDDLSEKVDALSNLVSDTNGRRVSFNGSSYSSPNIKKHIGKYKAISVISLIISIISLFLALRPYINMQIMF